MTSLTMERLSLVYLCIVSGSGMTSAGETGPDVVRLTVREGDDVVLTCSFGSSSIQTQLFDWKKDGQKEVFLYDNTVVYGDQRYGQDPQFKGRVSHYPGELVSGNASIRIRDTKVKDSGNYTCDFPRHQPSRRSRVSLVVEPTLRDRTAENIPGAAPEPSVTCLNQTKDRSLLQCSVKGASPKPRLHWQDSAGNLLPAEEPKVTKKDGRYDVILLTTVTKTDRYRCVATQEEIHHQTFAEIYEHFNGAAQKPSITILKTDDGMVLQCEVQGASPKPRLQWKDSAGDLLPVKDLQETERGGSYDVILQAAVTKTDNFLCVVTQQEINHQTEAGIYANDVDQQKVSDSSNREVVVGVVVGVVVFFVTLFVGGILVYLVVKRRITCLTQEAGSKTETESALKDPEPQQA